MSVRTLTRCMGLAALLAGAGVGVHAEDESLPPPEPAQVSRVELPNVATPSLPGYRTDMTELSYRRWATRGRADVGWGIGSMLFVERPTGLLPGRYGEGAGVTTGAGTMLMLGLRYRTGAQSSIYADAAQVRGLGLDGEDRVVGKVGIEFKAAQSNWRISYGGLGFRLAGDARMTVKLRRGGLGIYMRSTF